MIAGYARHGHGDKAVHILQCMLQNGEPPDKVTFIGALKASSVAQQSYALCRQLHTLIVEMGYDKDEFVQSSTIDGIVYNHVEPTITMGNLIISMYGKCGSLEDACSVFKAFQTPDVLSWTALLTAYISIGNSLEVLRLYHKMELKGLVAVKTTYVVVLDACADLLDLGTMEEILIRIMIKGLDLDATVATAIVSLYAVITMYAQNGHGKEAACLFSEMQDYGLVPNSVTFINLLAACSHAGLVEEGHYFLASMIWEYGTSPLVEHYDCAIDLFGRAGLLDEAECLINRMPFSPRVVSFMALMAAC
ncbi:hypothetical protein KP509_20G021300 [Ceratopteris richardii]|uniref:Pentatricopeptide repeat-containing protein n=1 Tax=Ceratopteris richardii TaxID=49495 RepID=A0A8T2SFU1_CERRI|nr:hypothetical protein KP509_20G021300 [Ceratopteris richardii]